MGNPFGRNVILPLTNQSGGSVTAGDVVYLDTAHDDSFTTGTTAAYTGGIGIAQQAIGAGSVGLVLVSGYASLINVNASVTRGHFGQTHTVAKQAADAGASRQAGTFCMFTKGGATPAGEVWQPDLGGGSGMTNPMSAVGDIIQGTTAGAPAALAAPAAGKVLTGAGVTTPLLYAYPPGYELDYAQITSPVTLTGTTEGSPTTVITGGSVSYGGSTIVLIEFWAPRIDMGSAATTILLLYEDSTLLGRFGTSTVTTIQWPVHSILRRTPSNASHTYTVKGYSNSGNSVVSPGAGGSGNDLAAFLRVTVVKP